MVSESVISKEVLSKWSFIGGLIIIPKPHHAHGHAETAIDVLQWYSSVQRRAVSTSSGKPIRTPPGFLSFPNGAKETVPVSVGLTMAHLK